MGYLDGFLITVKKTFAKGSQSGRVVTSEYAKDQGGKYTRPLRRHGRQVLNRYEEGRAKCHGCELVAGECPARRIYRSERRRVMKAWSGSRIAEGWRYTYKK